jgi:hypothetical protein
MDGLATVIRNGVARTNGTAGGQDIGRVEGRPLDSGVVPASSVERARAELDRFRREA